MQDFKEKALLIIAIKEGSLYRSEQRKCFFTARGTALYTCCDVIINKFGKL